LDVAKGGTFTGRTGEVMWTGPGTTPVDGIGTFHMERQNQTSKGLGTSGYCWIQQI